jgi:hypothetical protein
MRKYASYSHLRRCEIGTWQGLIRNREYNTTVPEAIEYLENAKFDPSLLGARALIYSVHLADFLFHKINFPENKSRRVRAIKNKLKLPRSRYNAFSWFADRTKHIDDMLTLLRHPLREEGDNEVEVGPFTLKNPINLGEDKVEEMKEACTQALSRCTNSLAPNFTQALYGDVVLVEKLGRASWYAWYSSTKDEITMKYMDRDKAEFIKTFIHEIGHRYYRKILSEDKKRLWRRYDLNCHYAQRLNLSDWIGKDINLYALKKRTKTSVGSNPNKGVPAKISRISHRGVYLVLPDGSEVGAYREKYIKEHIKAQTGIFPTTYATSDVEEHFCEALAYKAVGKLHPKSLEAFNNIIVDGVEYHPEGSNFRDIFVPSETEEVETTQVEETLPSKQEMVRTSESLASRLGLLFKKGRKYGLFVYTNQAVGSTHAYMFIDYATGNLFAPKTKSKPNLNVNLSNISNDNLDVCVGFERMSSLKPRWRTMNVITEPTQEPPQTEVVDQTPEPTIPTTPEGNEDAIIEASRAIASALGMTIKVLKRVIIFLYQNEEMNSTHTYLVVDKSNGYAHPPKHKVLAKTNISLGSVFEPNIMSKVGIEAMEQIQPSWRTKYKHPKRIR